jgi:[protein-PII] uridylyltransferase
VLSLVASDRPGLLYDVARLLSRYRISLQTARVNTLGDRVEDVFLIAGGALTDSRAVLNLEQDLLKVLTVQQPSAVAA